MRKRRQKRPLNKSKKKGLLSVLGIATAPKQDANVARTVVDVDAAVPTAAVEESAPPPPPPEQPLRTQAAPTAVEAVPPAVVQAFVRIATSAWRARLKMTDVDTGEPREEMRRVYRHIEGICDSLKEVGIETLDLTGRAYDSGMALKVVSFEQTPGLSKEEITETIKPAVIWNGRLVQLSEVIVGTP